MLPPPRAVEELLKLEQFSPKIWEPCCGGGHISETLIAHGYDVRSTDIADHGYGLPGIDFLAQKTPIGMDIVTNPPYIQAQAFVEHALSLLTEGHKAAMFLRLVFLETQARKTLFDRSPPARVHISSQRLGCAKNGEFKVRPMASSIILRRSPTPGSYGKRAIKGRRRSTGFKEERQ